jgi:hypothetical protein
MDCTAHFHMRSNESLSNNFVVYRDATYSVTHIQEGTGS